MVGARRPVTERELALLLVVAARLVPQGAVHAGVVPCPIRVATGVPCPSCGLGRSWSAATRGRLRESIGFHPMGPVALAVAVGYGLRLDERLPDPVRRRWLADGRWLLAGAWVLAWLARVAGVRGRRRAADPG